ncbi:hypothetical protein ACQPU1_11950 [Clostridium paraputrificum]|uniref:hypothetical protein n=1 Tax=Clostridium TaxID=1485 RepID=UPI003D34195F
MGKEGMIIRRTVRDMEKKLERTLMENKDLMRDNTALICDNKRLRTMVRELQKQIGGRAEVVKSKSTRAVIIFDSNNYKRN